jgi:hypothetical protein
MLKWIIKLIPKFIKTWIANLLYDDIAAKGIGGDTELAYLTSQQKAFLKSIGGADTLNPSTKLKQYFGPFTPLAVGLMVGTAAFGVAKLAGMSTRNALGIGLLGGLGAGGISGLLGGAGATSTGGSIASGKLAAAGGVGSTAAGETAAALSASMGGGTSAILGPGGSAIATPGALGAGSIGSIAPGVAGTGFNTMATRSLPLGTSGLFSPVKDAAGAVKSIVRPDLATSQAPTVTQGVGESISKFAKDPGTILGVGTTLASLAAQPKQQPYDDRDEDLFPGMGTSEGYLRQRALIDPASERAVYEEDDEELTPENVYEELDIMAAKEGGLATLKFKAGGVNYLPSKTDHDEKDANNYVRAMGYVEDGSGNGDKDEDTMLAQLADGEFVSRADAILGAGIMSGANPDDFKDMRRKGAQFFYKQQDSLKRVYDLVSNGNKAS